MRPRSSGVAPGFCFTYAALYVSVRGSLRGTHGLNARAPRSAFGATANVRSKAHEIEFANHVGWKPAASAWFASVAAVVGAMYSHTAVAPDCESASDSFEKS